MTNAILLFFAHPAADSVRTKDRISGKNFAVAAYNLFLEDGETVCDTRYVFGDTCEEACREALLQLGVEIEASPAEDEPFVFPDHLVALSKRLQAQPNDPEAEERLIEDPKWLAFYRNRLKPLLIAMASGSAKPSDFDDPALSDEMGRFQLYVAERIFAEKPPSTEPSVAALREMLDD